MNDLLTEEEIKQENKINSLIIRNQRKKLKRIPFHKQARIGLSSIDPDYHYRLVNDEGNNLERHLTGGYDFIEDKARGGAKDAADDSQMGKYASHCVDKTTGQMAYYMRIPNKTWKEDQLAKQTKVDRIEDQIKGGDDRIPEKIRRGSIEIDHIRNK